MENVLLCSLCMNLILVVFGWIGWLTAEDQVNERRSGVKTGIEKCGVLFGKPYLMTL